MRSLAGLCTIVIAMAIVGATAAPASAQQPTFNVVYQVNLDQHFGLYNSQTEEINFIVSGEPGPTNGSVVVSVFFSFIFKGIFGLPSGANYTVVSVSQHPVVNLISVTFPKGTHSFSFAIIGKDHGTSLAYRGSATISYATVSMNAPPYNPVSYQVLIPSSSRFEIASVFPGTGPGLATQYVTINGTSYLATGFSYLACFTQSCSVSIGANTISIIYQPQYFNYFIAVYLVFAVALLFGAGLVYRGRRQALSKVWQVGKKTAFRILTSLDSRRLLAALVIVSVLMISLGYVFGPTPTPRAYLAATPNTAQTLSPYITGAGFAYFTPDQAGDEFDLMSSLNAYRTVIVADYPPSFQSAGYHSIPRIMVMGEYANATLAKNLEAYYGSAVTVVNTPQQLQFDLALQSHGYNSNRLGLPISDSIYASVTLVEGLLSLALPFFALAFFARFMIESSTKGITRLAYGAAFSFFVFMFGELVYIQTDVLLTLPVALHATISPVETAIGVLGFGGGSRPRMVMGILGFLLGAFAGTVKGTRMDRVVLIGLTSALLFLLVDPLPLGQDFYNLLLQVTTSEGGTAVGQAAYTELRSFIAIFMNSFGNEVIPTFFSQHGAVLFFAGAIPFALYTYVRRSTATLLLFFSAAVAGVGYVRIGDQDALKAIASTTPGFAMAVIFIIAFLASDRVERFLRLRLGLG
ncbi:MAG: hypothetical protein OK436_01745 [Thaumarchaeota archaeon]|nr:hypothetical protein [Nitrososphaerota archaeon]